MIFSVEFFVLFVVDSFFVFFCCILIVEVVSVSWFLLLIKVMLVVWVSLCRVVVFSFLF